MRCEPSGVKRGRTPESFNDLVLFGCVNRRRMAGNAVQAGREFRCAGRKLASRMAISGQQIQQQHSEEHGLHLRPFLADRPAINAR
jgi:hypothetical protein